MRRSIRRRQFARLIPNRIYEGGYFGTPALAIRSHETGQVVEQRGLGITFEEPYFDNLVGLLRNMTCDQYIQLREQIEHLDVSEFVDERDTAKLIQERIAEP